MDNLQRVTDHLHWQLRDKPTWIDQVGQSQRTMKIPTPAWTAFSQPEFSIKKQNCFISISDIVLSPGGKRSFKDREGGYWRLLTWIENSRVVSIPASPVQGMEIGRLLGCFHHLLATLAPDTLHDTLPGFHHTPKYLQQYDQICGTRSFRNGREKRCAALINEYRGRADILERHRSLLTRSIIHADPKAGNFLFAKDSDTAISLIDLDTVMPGLLLYDLGDCLRSCCNPLSEKTKNPEQVVFDGEMFTAVLTGYCGQALGLLSEKDRELIVDAALLISFELGLRFFTDHLCGNTYFKVNRPDQNLQRALSQLNLAISIDKQRSALDLLWEQVIMASNYHKLAT
jgi:hypothetical protein